MSFIILGCNCANREKASEENWIEMKNKKLKLCNFFFKLSYFYFIFLKIFFSFRLHFFPQSFEKASRPFSWLRSIVNISSRCSDIQLSSTQWNFNEGPLWRPSHLTFVTTRNRKNSFRFCALLWKKNITKSRLFRKMKCRCSPNGKQTNTVYTHTAENLYLLP